MSLDILLYDKLDNTEVYIFEIFNLDDEEKQFIKDSLVEVYRGPKSNNSVKNVAKRILKFFDGKNKSSKGIDTIKGATAEFFIHLLLKKQGFKQECCFKNLEENSIKKGFDGLYTDDNDIWLVESKSSEAKNCNGSHRATLTRAYKGLKDMLEGSTSNDPWDNAVSHARNVGSIESLVTRLEQLSENYFEEEYENIEEHNIIPCSTIFIEDYIEIIKEKECCEVFDLVKDHTAKNKKVFCITNESISLFQDFLDEIIKEN